MLVPVAVLVLLNAFVGTMKQFDTIHAAARGTTSGDTTVIIPEQFRRC